MTDIDIFAEGMGPEKFEYKLFFIRMPHALDRKTGETITCRISVDQYGYCEMVDWYNFGLRDPHTSYNSLMDQKLIEAEKEVWEWLAEWELVELRRIGPEDSEYFATSKLTGDPNDDRR